MGKPQPIRNRKNEMISCWVCAFFVILIFAGKYFLLGMTEPGVFEYAMVILFVVWLAISVFYTIQYFRKGKES